MLNTTQTTTTASASRGAVYVIAFDGREYLAPGDHAWLYSTTTDPRAARVFATEAEAVAHRDKYFSKPGEWNGAGHVKNIFD